MGWRRGTLACCRCISLGVERQYTHRYFVATGVRLPPTTHATGRNKDRDRIEIRHTHCGYVFLSRTEDAHCLYDEWRTTTRA